ncbi:unnamed protein product [Gemmataceae bacterium]|nr:unnamed protein product [Gemmataceae bacterium]VTT99359.1 unnamed protein product [Gemmataceae bacterium]
MDAHALGELTARLRDRVAVVRAKRHDSGSLMPDDADLVRELAALAAECPSDTEPLAFWVVLGFLLYGKPNAPLCPARVAHATTYATRWQRRGGAIVFRDGGLLQLVFLYGLGVRRPAGAVGDESPEQAAVWGAAPWPGALLALRRFLIGLAVWLVTGLRRLGFRNVDLLGEFAASRSGRPAEAFGRSLADHTVGVLLGHTRCLCAELFRDANPGSPAGCAERRHEHRHLLTGYLDGHWPAGRNYASQPFPLTEHVFRAACGGQPTRPRALEEGIWFSLIRATSASLVVLKVLVCETCRNHLARFDECGTCGTAWPQNRITDWLATEDDERFRPAEGKECRRCGRLAPLGQATCACGSAGVGFTRVIKGTGQVACVACEKLLPRTLHACPHAPCLNADYGGVTNFHLRLDEASVETVPVCSGPHRGSGVFRRPIPRKVEVADGFADAAPELPEGTPETRADVTQTPLPLALQDARRPVVELAVDPVETLLAPTVARTRTHALALGRES